MLFSLHHLVRHRTILARLALLLTVMTVLVSVPILTNLSPVAWQSTPTIGFPINTPAYLTSLIAVPESETFLSGTAESGIYRSEDGGMTWTASSNGLTSRVVNALLQIPERGLILAATDNGVYLSKDRGEMWNLLHPELFGDPIQSITPIGVDGLLLGRASGGVKHFDWEQLKVTDLSNGLGSEPVNAVSAMSSSLPWLAGTRQGLFLFHLDRSSDTLSGQWKPVVINSESLSVLALAPSTSLGGVIIGTDGQGAFLLRSETERPLAILPWLDLTVPVVFVRPNNNDVLIGTNRGLLQLDLAKNQWMHRTPPTQMHVTTIAEGNGQGNLLLGTSQGLLRSEDNGGSWHTVVQEPSHLNVQTILTWNKRELLFAITEKGALFQSNNDGATWRAVENGLANAQLQSILVSPDGQQLLATSKDGTFLSSQDGESWSVLSVPGMQRFRDQLLNASPVIPSTLLGGWGDVIVAQGVTSGTVTLSLNDISWRQANAPLDIAKATGVVVTTSGVVLLATDNQGILLSNDRGRSWTTVSDSRLSQVRVVVSGPQGTIFAATPFGDVYSTINGISWDLVLKGTEILSVQPFSVRALVVTPEGHMLIGTDKGLLRIANGKATRVTGHPGILEITSLSPSTDGKTFFAATARGGLFRSSDAGHSWFSTNHGLTDLTINDLIAMPGGKILLAGTNGRGVFRSEDGGRSWFPFGTNLVARTISALAVSPDGRHIFAGAAGHGVLHYDVEQQEWEPYNEGLPLIEQNPLIQGFVPVTSVDIIVDPTEYTLYLQMDNPRLPLFRREINGGHWQPVNEPGVVAKFYVGPPDMSNTTLTGYDLSLLRPYSVDSDVASNRLLSSQSQPQIYFLVRSGRLYIARLGVGWLPWVDPRPYQPTALMLEDQGATLYAMTTARTLNYVSVPFPVAWVLPNPLLASLAIPLTIINILGNDPVIIQVLAFLSYLTFATFTLVAVISMSQVGLKTTLQLLLQPNHLFAIRKYRSYIRRVSTSLPLEQLVLYKVPTKDSFGIADVAAVLAQAQIRVERAEIKSTLQRLSEMELLRGVDDQWSIVSPTLHEILLLQLSDMKVQSIAKSIRASNSNYVELERFMRQAGYTVTVTDSSGWRCESDQLVWQDLSPLYLRMLIDERLNIETFQTILMDAEKVFRTDEGQRAIVLVLDQPPRGSDLYQVFALRAQRDFVIILLPRTTLSQARLDGQEAVVLREQADLYLGRDNLYDVRVAVTDILSFFGRAATLAELRQRLMRGHPVLVFGVRKIGKSSLIGRLREEFSWPAAFVDLEHYADGIEYIYEEISRRWIASVHTLLPDTSAVEMFPAQRAEEPAMQMRYVAEHLLSVLDSAKQSAGLLLILDEVDALINHPGYPTFAAALRALVQHPVYAGRIAIIAAGLDPLLNRVDRLANRRNPFFAFFHELALAPLEPEDAQSMIVTIGGQMGVHYSDNALALLVHAGGGHPFLTRQLCSVAVQAGERPMNITEVEAREAIARYLNGARNYLAMSLWGVDTGGPPAAEAELLMMLAQKQPLTEDDLIPSDLPPEHFRARQLAFERLQDQQMVQFEAGGWMITIPLYCEWIRRSVLRIRDSGSIAQR